MSLAPDLEAIYGSYEFCDEERRQLIALLKENNKQFRKETSKDEPEYAKWDEANKLYKELSHDALDFFDDYCDYTIAWKYSTQDLIDANNEIIKLLKGE